MSDPKLFPDGRWEFFVREGQEFHGLETYYPASLTVYMDRRQALAELESLARQIREGDENQTVRLSWSGAIRRLPEAQP